MYQLPGDVIVLPEAEGHWLIMNVFTQTCLAVDSAALEVLRAAETLADAELQTQFAHRTFSVWEVGYFSNSEGLLADPTRYIRDVAKWPQTQNLEVGALVEQFKKYFFLIDDKTAYRARFAPKTSLLDHEHFGNFHQQLGQELMLIQRVSPNKWWLRQKFTEDMRQVRNNLYGAIQAHYLENYFWRKFSSNDVVIDIGCGTGFYSNMMARTGASVLGVDPSEDYIRIARANAIERAQFEMAQVGRAHALDQIPSHYADYVFMSDALLFYFVPVGPNQVAQIEVLFEDIRRILKPDGCFISVEPHYVFWLLPWLGEVDHPFTILTEYLHRTFGVTANMGELIQAFAKGGFVVSWLEELTPDPSWEATDPRAYHFARQFPLWQLYELKCTHSSPSG